MTEEENTQRLLDIEFLVRELVWDDRWDPLYETHTGDLQCMFCSASGSARRFIHDGDCFYMTARILTRGGPRVVLRKVPLP